MEATSNITSGAFDPGLFSMFINADFVVQFIMLFLLCASIYSWSVIFSKGMRLRSLEQSALKFERTFWSGGSLEALYERLESEKKDPLGEVFSAGMGEWKRLKGRDAGRFQMPEKQGFLTRLDVVMQVAMRRQLAREESQISILATISSASPFIGLFGTVWGIMNSFQGIAMSQSTNLSVVAPGIAEALFATAIGLIAAIPALVAYNHFSKAIDDYAERLENFQSEFLCLVSRKLEE